MATTLSFNNILQNIRTHIYTHACRYFGQTSKYSDLRKLHTMRLKFGSVTLQSKLLKKTIRIKPNIVVKHENRKWRFYLISFRNHETNRVTEAIIRLTFGSSWQNSWPWWYELLSIAVCRFGAGNTLATVYQILEQLIQKQTWAQLCHIGSIEAV